MSSKAQNVLNESIAIDCLHHCLFIDPPIEADDKTNLIDMLLAGGVTCISDTVLDDNYPSTFDEFCKATIDYYLLEDTLPDQVLIVNNAIDIERAKREHKLAVILSTQGSELFQRDLRYVQLAYRQGLRIAQLTYNQQGSLGSGVYEPEDHGLTRFGQQCIYEFNRLGIVMDLSHVGERTSLEAIDHSDDPAIFSHSSTKALCHHRRNASDEQIKRCSAKGGVICVCPHSIMCDDDNSKWPTVDRFIDHILHIAEIASIDNVGVGTDRWKRSTLFAKMKRISFGRTLPGWYGGFDDFHKQVEGFNYFDKWENFVDRMLARGLSGQEASKVLGGNLMRVFHQVMDKNIAK